MWSALKVTSVDAFEHDSRHSATRPAVGAPLERVVRRHGRQRYACSCLGLQRVNCIDRVDRVRAFTVVARKTYSPNDKMITSDFNDLIVVYSPLRNALANVDGAPRVADNDLRASEP